RCRFLGDLIPNALRKNLAINQLSCHMHPCNDLSPSLLGGEEEVEPLSSVASVLELRSLPHLPPLQRGGNSGWDTDNSSVDAQSLHINKGPCTESRIGVDFDASAANRSVNPHRVPSSQNCVRSRFYYPCFRSRLPRAADYRSKESC